jgi:hypothetical protein
MLQIGDNSMGKYTKEYMLTDYKCHTLRRVDEYRPNTEMYCDYIEMTVVAPGKEDMSLYEWFVKQTTFSGRILVQLPPKPFTMDTNNHEILFEKAQCFSFEEDYHINKDQRRTLKVRFVAKEVVINDTTFYRK